MTKCHCCAEGWQLCAAYSYHVVGCGAKELLTANNTLWVTAGQKRGTKHLVLY